MLVPLFEVVSQFVTWTTTVSPQSAMRVGPGMDLKVQVESVCVANVVDSDVVSPIDSHG
jgi:hypothetical protein